MRILFLSAAFAALLTTPAMAREAAAPQSFERDGMTYTYTATDKGAYTVLEGTAQPGDRDFRLVVRGNRVRGFTNGQLVSFTYKARDTQVAAR